MPKPIAAELSLYTTNGHEILLPFLALCPSTQPLNNFHILPHYACKDSKHISPLKHHHRLNKLNVVLARALHLIIKPI